MVRSSLVRCFVYDNIEKDEAEPKGEADADKQSYSSVG